MVKPPKTSDFALYAEHCGMDFLILGIIVQRVTEIDHMVSVTYIVQSCDFLCIKYIMHVHVVSLVMRDSGELRCPATALIRRHSMDFSWEWLCSLQR